MLLVIPRLLRFKSPSIYNVANESFAYRFNLLLRVFMIWFDPVFSYCYQKHILVTLHFCRTLRICNVWQLSLCVHVYQYGSERLPNVSVVHWMSLTSAITERQYRRCATVIVKCMQWTALFIYFFVFRTDFFLFNEHFQKCRCPWQRHTICRLSNECRQRCHDSNRSKHNINSMISLFWHSSV